MTKYFFIIIFILFQFAGISQQTEIKYLSGHGKDDMVKWQFFCSGGMNANKWTTIGVPSCWELQGFGKYDYGFAKDSTRGREKGMYKYVFQVPSTWKNKQINIDFEGVMTDAEIKINGQLAGPIHQGAFYAFKYDISTLIKFDADNLLEVTVAKQSANASVNAAERKADFWIFGGIFRPVFLEALPINHIEHVAINAKADGDFSADIFTTGGGDKLTVELFNNTGIKFGKTITVTNGNAKENHIIAAKFNSPKLWSAEFPNLYKAEFKLWKDGKVLHAISQKFGFRTIEVKERDGVYINGVKIKFKGVNHHSFWPNSGRTMSAALSIEDVSLMKDMNMNAVRMSHYPPDTHFLEVCDSLGLYVMDELTGWHGHYDTPTGTKLVKEMLVHDVNHPSIVFWSNGNEGGHNLELDHLFTDIDPQKRPVIHPWQAFGGFDTQHYREYDYGIGNYMHGHDIVMPTEFLHGLYDGGHGAGLEDYWEAMWKDPTAAGGFLWDFADEGVLRTDKDSLIDTDGNHGADGIIGPYHEKEGSYFTIKEVWSPIYFEKKDITAAFDGVLHIENRYAFTNLNQCFFSWKLEKFDATNNLIKTGSAISPSIKPFEKGDLRIGLPINWKDFDVLYITAKDPNKKQIFTWSFPISCPDKIASTIIKKERNNEIKLSEIDSLFQISANGISISINKNTGVLQEVKNANGIIPFNNGPILQEGVNNFSNFTHRMENGNLIIESAFDKKKSWNTLQWTIYPSGWIKMKINYFPADYFTNFIGANFSFPQKEIKGVEYMGNGPYRVWKNRMKGTQFGVWDKTYNNTETGEQWVYPEFKGYYSNLYWCKFLTNSNNNFTAVTDKEDIFLRLFSAAWKTDQWHNYEPIFPNGDISFMQGISSIGTKTQRNETTGPMGMKNIFYDYDKDPNRALELTVYFDFSGKSPKAIK